MLHKHSPYQMCAYVLHICINCFQVLQQLAAATVRLAAASRGVEGGGVPAAAFQEATAGVLTACQALVALVVSMRSQPHASQ